MILSLLFRRLAANRLVSRRFLAANVEQPDIGIDKDDLEPWKRSYVTERTNPMNHSPSDLSFLYQIPNSEFKTVFSQGLPRNYRKEVDIFGQAGLLVRKPALKIINSLKNVKNDAPRFLISGPDGCGKSLTLAHAIHFGFKAGWLIVYLPSAFQLVHSQKPTRHSHRNPTQFDQPDESVAWLKNFRLMNDRFLGEMSLSSNYTWGKKDVTHAGDPLARVIDQGLYKPVHATDAVGVLLKEVALQQDKRNVLFAVDAFNGFFGMCSARNPDGNKIGVESLGMRRHFLRALQSMKCGAVVLALSRSGSLGETLPSCSPKALLGDEGLAALKPCVNVRVENYNQDEMISMMNYYSSKHWLSGGYTQEKLNEIAFLTQRSPVALRKLCDPF